VPTARTGLSASLVLPCLLAVPATELHAAESAGDGTGGGMPGLYGAYDMQREASGTSWQPDTTPMSGIHAMREEWTTMLHGFVDATYDDQGGPRGAAQSFSSSMLMFVARRDLPTGAFGVHLMLSGDPLMGASGYPLLFQTGETADGRRPLIDRQHPHNLLMEAAATWSRDFDPASVFLYAGPAGEPALGPTAFMHRLSALDNPEAPIAHHWLDSTHVSYGVVTAGIVWRTFKLDASVFNGREPDQHRYDVELRGLDSRSARLTWNATAALSMQVSSGRLAAPEQLEPSIDVQRTTASVTYNAPLAADWWQTTIAWGRNAPSQGPASDGWLLESAMKLGADHTVFARAERVAKDDLFLSGAPLYGETFTVNKLTVGYVFDFARFGAASCGVGALLSEYSHAQALNSVYGTRPTSFMLFARMKL
jgi:hypothetical protein